MYPADAYGAEGVLWWEMPTLPGKRARLGAEPRIAAWLAYNKRPGDLFTTAEIRENVRDLEADNRNDDEHLQRRLRELRGRDGWTIPSHKYVDLVPNGSYRVDVIGWHPGLGTKRPAKSTVSTATRRLVFERDGSRCQVCGVGRAEPYPHDPARLAVMTIGHVVASSHRGGSDPSNLRTECSMCNETARANTTRPISIDEFEEKLRALPTTQADTLHRWIALGHRTRDKLDRAYDSYRDLAPGDQAAARDLINYRLGLAPEL